MATQQRGSNVRFDLGGLAFVVMLALIVLAPLQRGLFFDPEFDGFAVIVGGVLALVAIDHAVRGRMAFVTKPLDWAAMALALGYWIAYMRTPVAPYQALQGALRAGVLLAWYWIAAAAVATPRRFTVLLHTLVGTGALLALIGCLAAAGKLTVPSAVVDKRILSTIQYANSFGAVLVFSAILAASLTLANWSSQQQSSRRRTGSINVQSAVYGAVSVLLLATLLGTTSRGAWLIFAVGSVLWILGLQPGQRWAGVIALAWPSAIAVLLSRTILDGFWGGQGTRSLVVLAVGMVVGAAGFAVERPVVAAWSRQRFTPEVRRALQGVAGLYVAGVVTFLLVSTSGSTAALAGRGIVSAQVAQQANSISVDTPDFLSRVVMWQDGLKLVGRQPLLGFGGGGWAALYHTVQSALYWSTQTHESILQAWIDGGLLAAAGMAAVGLLVFFAGWRRRGGGGGAGLTWGLTAAACALWAHSLADFDMSIPAVAMVLWGAAGALRGAEPPAASSPRTVTVVRGLAGGVAVAVVGVALLVAGNRLEQAGALAAVGAQDLAAKQYADAYTNYQASLDLEPLSPSVLADKAQLLAVAYATDHNQAFRQQAADTALAAMQFGTGDFQVATAAINVLGATNHWPGVEDGANALLASFPLDPTVTGLASQALVHAGVGEISSGDFASAGAALKRAAAAGQDLQQVYAARSTRLAASKFDPPTLDENGLLAEGQGDALLGRWTEAEATLSPLLKSRTPSIAQQARIWLTVSEERSGQTALADTTFAPLQNNAGAQTERNEAMRLTGFTREVNQG